MTLVEPLTLKLKQQMQKTLDSTTARVRGLENTKASLQSNSTKIKHITSQLQTKISEADGALQWYESNLSNIQTQVDAMLKQEDEMDIDNAVMGSCILHSQLIELEAEHAAIDDCMHEVQKGLRGRASDLTTMLDRIRVLSENQFDVMEKIKLAKQTVIQASGR